jgi:hypothetical protein
MVYRLPQRLTALPNTWQARLELMKAIHAFATEHEDEQLRQRRAEIAALRRDFEKLADSLRTLRREWPPLMASVVRKYSPTQPRVPAGNPDGGRWAQEGESGASSDLPDSPDDRADAIPDNGRPHTATASDSRVISDATSDDTLKPGTQYAANDEEGEGDGRIDGAPDAANDNLTPEQTCRQAYSDAVAFARINPSLSPAEYLEVRKEIAQSLDDCLDLANGSRSIYRDGNFVFFHGGGIVIFRQGRPPIYGWLPGRQ